MSAVAVIGAGFGDEGKGVLTDFLCSERADACVIRFNGGAQAGHTVVTPEGRRHVFHHFGSGLLVGAATYLSEHFIVNPFLWHKEWLELKPIGHPLMVHPQALLTTPYDMLLNQGIEQRRGGSRHGSCGVGINETVERSLTPYATRVCELRQSLSKFREKLDLIRLEYAPQRMKRLGLAEGDWPMKLLLSTELRDSYLETCECFSLETGFCGYMALCGWREFVFEGAQGLLLDQNHGFFPYVTRGNTGLKNVVEIAKQFGLSNLEVVYVTRSYMTRHGAGPFPTEVKGLRYEDPTNVHNQFQGSLRFGSLDKELINEAIVNDLRHAVGMKIDASMALTCLDQQQVSIEGFHLPVRYESRGPARSSVGLSVEAFA